MLCRFVTVAITASTSTSTSTSTDFIRRLQIAVLGRMTTISARLARRTFYHKENRVVHRRSVKELKKVLDVFLVLQMQVAMKSRRLISSIVCLPCRSDNVFIRSHKQFEPGVSVLRLGAFIEPIGDKGAKDR